MVNPSIQDWPPKHPAERRLTLQLYQFWEGQRCEAGLINENHIDPDALSDIWESCCLLQVHDLLNKDNYSYTFVGEHIIEQFSQLHNWQAEQPIISPIAKTAHPLFLAALKTGVPIFGEGMLKDGRGGEILYRQCVLPVGKNGNIEAFLAGIRLKI